MKIVNVSQGSAAWLKWRQQGITATDAVVLLGLSPYKSVWRLWAEKVGFAREADLSLNPLAPHQLSQWFGNVELDLQQKDVFEPNVLEPTDDLPQEGLAHAMGGPGILLDFGPDFNTESLDFG